MSSNRYVLVDREIIDGSIGGCDFGPKLWCLARSEASILVWIFGHSWSNNGFSNYAAPHLCCVPRKTSSDRYWSPPDRSWTRLTPIRFQEVWRDHWLKFADFFKEDYVEQEIKKAIRFRKTLIIEGGGKTLAPSRSLGWEASREWKLQHLGTNR